MIEELRVQSVGGLSSAQLTFQKGLTAITGESGSGKSSLVRALELVAGKRGAATVIRSGDETATVEALFQTELDFQELEEELRPQEQVFMVRREISRSGRGRCSLQNRSIPLGVLIDAAPRLMTLQSQFAQLNLLEPQRQLEILDTCGGPALQQKLRELADSFQHILQMERQLRKIRQEEQDLQKRFASAESVLALIKGNDATGLDESEIEKRLQQTQQETNRLSEVRHRRRQLSDGEGSGLIHDVTTVLSGLDLLISSQAEPLVHHSEQARNALEHLCRILDDAAPGDVLDELEDEAKSLEEQLGRLRKCRRLAGLEAGEDLCVWIDEARVAMQWLIDVKPRRQALAEEMASARRQIALCARQLGELRRDAATTLQRNVSIHLKDLAMEHCEFVVQLHQNDKIRLSGAEDVEFLLRRGHDVVPVAKGASGGELSRILLALQLSLPAELTPPTIVFDEVEAGLGGKAALLTGLKLRDLSRTVQVLLVTHEATIAALADSHYGVTRSGDETDISLLSREGRIKEIARMLSGDGQDTKALAYARHLLDEAEQMGRRVTE